MSAAATTSRAGRWIAVVASVVVIATVVAAIAVIGSPSRQRLLRLDERRVNDLEAIASQVRAYREQHDSMPASLVTLSAEPGVRVPRDPASAQPYGYEALGGADYRLCARFDTDTADSDAQTSPRAAAWVHGAGPQCFRRRVDSLAAPR